MSPDKKKFVPWQRALQNILDKHNHLKQNKTRIVSNRTMEARANVIFAGFRTLRDLGFKLEDPCNFKPKHMTALAQFWEKEELKPATIQGRISIFRIFCEWINKPGMIGPSEDFVKDPLSVKRHYAAEHDKSWTGNHVDYEEILKKAKAENAYFAMQMEMLCAFGLRQKEAVMFHPFRADKGIYIVASDGTKGKRARIIPIDTPYKIDVLARAKEFAKTPNGHIGRPDKTLDQNMKFYGNKMTKLGLTKKDLGVTGHGLRHQYAIDRFEEATGGKAPVRGGRPREIDPAVALLAKAMVSEELGHVRTSITAAYLGADRPPSKNPRLYKTEAAPAASDCIAEQGMEEVVKAVTPDKDVDADK